MGGMLFTVYETSRHSNLDRINCRVIKKEEVDSDQVEGYHEENVTAVNWKVEKENINSM
jgi:hypothetical protein